MNSARMPLVSIITPSFNSGDFLEEAIRSVISQDYPDLEHIIVDGGSTDGTLEILDRYDTPVRWTSEPDEGQADAINKGFRQAKGEIIGWLNADDTYQPGAIAAAVAYLQTHPEIDLVYGNLNFIDGDNRLIYRHTAPQFSLERMLYGDAIIPQTSMFVRQQVIEASGGVNPELHYVMDWEFTLRIAQAYQVARVAETWGNFRIVAGTKSVQQPERFWPEIIAVTQKVVQAAPQRFERVAEDALFMGHLRAALEFARNGQLSASKTYIAQAFHLSPQPQSHPAVLASALYQQAVHPWHSAFNPHPQAATALDNLLLSLGDSSVELRIRGYLTLYRAVKSFQKGAWREGRERITQATASLSRQDVMHWRLARMMLGAMLKQ